MNTAATHPVAPEEIMAFFDGELARRSSANSRQSYRRLRECANIAGKFRGLSKSLTGWSISPVSQKLEEAVYDFASKILCKKQEPQGFCAFPLQHLESEALGVWRT